MKPTYKNIKLKHYIKEKSFERRELLKINDNLSKQTKRTHITIQAKGFNEPTGLVSPCTLNMRHIPF